MNNGRAAFRKNLNYYSQSNGMCYVGHVLSTNSDDVLRRTFDVKMVGRAE